MRKRIAVIGDLMIDVDNIVGEKKEREGRDCLVIQSRTERLGTAGAVAMLLKALKIDPILIGIANINQVPSIRQMAGCTCHILGAQSETTRRERFYFENWSIAGPRVDFNCKDPVSDQDQCYLSDRAIGCAADAFIVCDHGRGVVGPIMMEKMKKTGKPIFVDPCLTSDYSLFSEVEALCLNRDESLAATAAEPSPKNIMQKFDEDGLVWFREGWLFPPERTYENRNEFDSHKLQFPSMANEIVDSLGAGDQFIATLAAARLNGNHWEPSIALAMAAAGLQCEQRGIVPIEWKAIEERLNWKLDPGGKPLGTTAEARHEGDNVPRLLGGNSDTIDA